MPIRPAQSLHLVFKRNEGQLWWEDCLSPGLDC